MQIKVDADIQQAQKYLRKVGERNIPLAVAQSLTATAKHLKNVQSRSMTKHFDRPTKFTQNAFRLKIAKAREFKTGVMSSAIIAKDIQQQYLSFQVDGGTRHPRKRAIVVPGPDAKLNRFGNMSRKYLRTQLAKPNVFSGRIGNINGIWERPRRTRRGAKSRLKLIAIYTPTADYDKRYPYFKISERVVPRELVKQLNRGIKRAARARA